MNLLAVAGVVLLVLKLVGVVSVSWWWIGGLILSPLVIWAVFATLIGLFGLLAASAAAVISIF